MSANQIYEENVCMEEDCKSEVTVQCRSHNLNICSKCFTLLHTFCPEINIIKYKEMFSTSLKCIMDTIYDMREFNSKFHSSLSKKLTAFDRELDLIEENIGNLLKDKRSFQIKTQECIKQMRDLKRSIFYQEYTSEMAIRYREKFDDDSNIDSKIKKIVERKEKEIRSDFDQKINDLNQKYSSLSKNLKSEVDRIVNKFTSEMENLSLDHETTKNKVEKIEARQTALEETSKIFSKETSEIKNLLIEGFSGMSDINKDTNNKIESLNEKLHSHIKGCFNKPVNSKDSQYDSNSTPTKENNDTLNKDEVILYPEKNDDFAKCGDEEDKEVENNNENEYEILSKNQNTLKSEGLKKLELQSKEFYTSKLGSVFKSDDFSKSSEIYNKLGQHNYTVKYPNNIEECTNTDPQGCKYIYIGQLKDGTKGKAHGVGIKVWVNGSIVEGEWKNGERNGYCRGIRGDGEYYIGEYNNGLRHGYGEHYFSNGNIYKGNWVNNYMKGQGTMTYNDGTVESGLWEEASG